MSACIAKKMDKKLTHVLTLGMTLLSAMTLFAAFILQPPLNQAAHAQEAKNANVAKKSTKVIKTAIPILLSDGYQIESMQYLENSMVFVLQRGLIAFVCETDHNGISKLCVQIQ